MRKEGRQTGGQRGDEQPLNKARHDESLKVFRKGADDIAADHDEASR